ncbi:TIR domain-containing protein [Parvularcula flava]|uniref:TIR domain-containing protein n=1 Tax=Aquisalinus luteolus TaxID=1566827 RepID=A0A8J3A578_9PROT|nr:toll/interleukin-1 receptor domain-containing protein [Aquisalinus luteolus]NHK28693.1 TIR domain-containing protein [Aquisalinus luteolus]GGH99234.1 hypothetical protein GCM10011355_24710 [Aquisalinus luteolus]
MDEFKLNTVFISYNRNDTRRVERVLKALDKTGIPYWIDRSGIEPSDNWASTITRNIRFAGAFVLFQSKSYYTRQDSFLHKEVEIAVNLLREKHADARWFFTYQLDKVEAPRRSQVILAERLKVLLEDPELNKGTLRVTNASKEGGKLFVARRRDNQGLTLPPDPRVKGYSDAPMKQVFALRELSQGETATIDLAADKWIFAFGNIRDTDTSGRTYSKYEFRGSKLIEVDLPPRQTRHFKAIRTRKTGGFWSKRESEYYFTIEE